MAYLKNGNIDHPVKEISAALSTELTYKTHHISLLRDSIMSSVLNFILEEMEIVKKEIFICEISIIIFFTCLKLALVQPLQQKFNLPLPYS